MEWKIEDDAIFYYSSFGYISGWNEMAQTQDYKFQQTISDWKAKINATKNPSNLL